MMCDRIYLLVCSDTHVLDGVMKTKILFYRITAVKGITRGGILSYRVVYVLQLFQIKEHFIFKN